MLSPVEARSASCGLVVGLLLLVAGCGAPNMGQVSGKVVFDDGRPATAGEVLLTPSEDASLPAALGYIQPDGAFELFTTQPGDGARLGKYHVLVMPLADDYSAKHPRPIDAKFADPATSGIHFEVKLGDNTLNITVHPPRR